MLDDSGKVKPLEANIYVDDILAAAAFKENMMRLLAATIEAIFLVCGQPDIAVRQCPLSLEKWFELIVGPRQIVLGLLVDTEKNDCEFNRRIHPASSKPSGSMGSR